MKNPPEVSKLPGVRLHFCMRKVVFGGETSDHRGLAQALQKACRIVAGQFPQQGAQRRAGPALHEKVNGNG